MKKNRLLFLLPLIASFVLTSCDMLSNLNFNGPRKRSSEEASEVEDDYDSYGFPISTSSNKSSSKSSSRSSSSRSSSSSNNSSTAHQHTWSEWTVVVAATCTESGYQERRCTVCDVAETRTIAALGHDWNDWEVISAPTCTQNGIMRRRCVRCNTLEQRAMNATGHDYDMNNVVWENEATCETGGVGYATCKNCGAQTRVTVAAYGHDIFLLDHQDPTLGTADTRVYQCRRCGLTTLTFGVDSLTQESKAGLVYESDGGARYWGRPIGNAIELSDDGDPSDADMSVYDETVLGNYFEIKFELTSSQAAALSTCQCYCDAKPANYLDNKDFWARNPADEDWTPGYYIEGDRAGEQITNYRYLLYVDDVQMDFDPTIQVMAEGRTINMTRKEYLMPFTFHLHEGLNSIRLHMAGSYRSEFYSFNFRPVTLPQHIHNWSNEQLIAAHAEGYVGYTASSCPIDGAVQLSINALDGTFDEGSKNKSGSLEGYMKLAANNNSISYRFMYEGPSTTAKLYQVGYMDSWSNNRNRTYTSASTAGSQVLSPCGCNFGVNFNGMEVEIDEETKNTPYEVFLEGATTVVDSSNCSNAGPCYIGEVGLVMGENILRYTRYASYNLNISHLLLVIE